MGSDSTFAKGDRVDRYEIDELIAEGGMGAIYRAIDTKLRRTVALKVVRADRLDSTASGDMARQRFLREALAISKVDHRNVVRVLDFGFVGDTPYLAMEYLRGRDLGQVIKTTAGFLPVSDVIDVMLSVCAAIRACHEAGIIHRDLKPSNVFLCEGDSEPEVKILDFGVSKPPLASDLTREGQIVGTPQYLAPEQVDGKAVPQTDQYAIGVMLYAGLTKSLPYRNHASLGLLRAILVGKFDLPRALRPDLPEKLEAIILRAMRGAPQERFDSVHALGRELWAFGSDNAREKWRSYYLDDRAKAPPKVSTHAMPLIEAMARGLSPATRSSDPAGFLETMPAAPPITPTRLLAGGTVALPAPPIASAPIPRARPGGTVDLRRPPTAPAPIQRRRRARGGARTAIAVALLAPVLAAGAWLVLRRPSAFDPRRPRVPAAPVRSIVVPDAPEVAPQAPEPARSPPPPVLAPSPPEPPEPTETRPRRNHRRRAIEQTPDGVPIMP